ncbi:MAG: lysylphosphatidylglycerol synthase transmembrane domain-containing protein [Flavobacteriaceae bacterium]
MEFKIKKNLQITLPLAIGFGLVWYSLRNIKPEEFIGYFLEADYTWIALGLFFGILSHLSRAYRWKFMLEPLGFNPKYANSVMAVLIAYLVNLTIPRAGEASRAAVMSNYEGIPFQKGFGTIVAERVADLVMLLVVIVITLFVQFDFIWELATKNFNLLKIGIGILGFIASVIFFILFIKKANKGIGLKIKVFIKGLVEGVMTIFKMKKKWPFIFHTIFIWLMYVLMFWATIPAIDGLSVPIGGILVGFIAGGFSIAATNGGLGTYPVAVMGAFLLFGIPKELGTEFGWVMWTAQTAMIIIFGGLSFLLLPIFNKAK